MQTGTMRLRELTVRYSVRKDCDGQPMVVGRDLGSPSETAASLVTMLQDEPSEVFGILCITTKHRVIAFHEVSRGTLDATLVHPREVFKVAFLANAAAIILTHYVPRNIMRLMCPESLCAGGSAIASPSAACRSQRAHNDVCPPMKHRPRAGQTGGYPPSG